MIPASVTSLEFQYGPLGSLPRNLKTLKSAAQLNCSNISPESLPPLITDLDLGIYFVLQGMTWPSSLTRVAQCTDPDVLGDPTFTESLPPGLEKIILPHFEVVLQEQAIQQLPSSLLSICFPAPGRSATPSQEGADLGVFSPQLLRVLPRSLTELTVYLKLDGLRIGDLPSRLTCLELYTTGNLNPDFSSFLPPTLRSLNMKFAICPPNKKFYSALPKTLTHFCSHVDDIGSSVVFPPNLTKLIFGAEYLNFTNGHSKCAQYPNDGDATLKPIALAPWSSQSWSARSEVTLSSAIKRPFPFLLLPKTITSFIYNDRPIPASALLFFPQLSHLSALEVVRDPKFNPKSPQLVAQVNEARSKLLLQNPSVALPMLTEVGIFDVFPRCISSMWIVRSGELDVATVDDWKREYPQLQWFTGANYRRQIAPRALSAPPTW